MLVLRVLIITEALVPADADDDAVPDPVSRLVKSAQSYPSLLLDSCISVFHGGFVVGTNPTVNDICRSKNPAMHKRHVVASFG